MWVKHVEGMDLEQQTFLFWYAILFWNAFFQKSEFLFALKLKRINLLYVEIKTFVRIHIRIREIMWK